MAAFAAGFDRFLNPMHHYDLPRPGNLILGRGTCVSCKSSFVHVRALNGGDGSLETILDGSGWRNRFHRIKIEKCLWLKLSAQP